MTLYSELQIARKVIIDYQKVIRRKNKKIDRLRFIIKKINQENNSNQSQNKQLKYGKSSYK